LSTLNREVKLQDDIYGQKLKSLNSQLKAQHDRQVQDIKRAYDDQLSKDQQQIIKANNTIKLNNQEI
jgi:hypothetical protein